MAFYHTVVRIEFVGNLHCSRTALFHVSDLHLFSTGVSWSTCKKYLYAVALVCVVSNYNMN